MNIHTFRFLGHVLFLISYLSLYIHFVHRSIPHPWCWIDQESLKALLSVGKQHTYPGFTKVVSSAQRLPYTWERRVQKMERELQNPKQGRKNYQPKTNTSLFAQVGQQQNEVYKTYVSSFNSNRDYFRFLTPCARLPDIAGLLRVCDFRQKRSVYKKRNNDFRKRMFHFSNNLPFSFQKTIKNNVPSLFSSKLY